MTGQNIQVLPPIQLLRNRIMYPNTQLLINGEWQAAQSGASIPVINPATEQTIGHVAKAGQIDLERAVATSVQGFAIWKTTAPNERARIMRQAAELLRQRADGIAEIMTAEHGKTRAQARYEVTSSADIIDWFAGEASRTYGQVIPSRSSLVQQTTQRVPVGPVAAFTPWNFPISQIVRKLSAALAAGCSIIVKGPEETPASPAELIRAFQDAGVPAGVIGLVYGAPAEVSSYLIPHPAIRKVSFTGSTRVGKQLAAMAAAEMKKFTMELGGHAPVLVFADADIDAAVAQMVQLKYMNAGQICIAPTRFLVEQPVYEAFVAKFTAAVNTIVTGDGSQTETTMGPMAHQRGMANIQAMIDDAVRLGATITTGGYRLDRAGYFFAPTVVRDVPQQALAMNEEPFGPLALITPFANYDAAIAEANRLPYGLAAYAYTASIRTVQALRRDIESGMLSINHMGLALPEVPFGGVKDSGIGTEGGSEAIEAYLETRFVTVAG
jgi:succinate-semialdehyde dehydrogenase/glutarate-semialdehyde dehydrogenase